MGHSKRQLHGQPATTDLSSDAKSSVKRRNAISSSLSISSEKVSSMAELPTDDGRSQQTKVEPGKSDSSLTLFSDSERVIENIDQKSLQSTESPKSLESRESPRLSQSPEEIASVESVWSSESVQSMQSSDSLEQVQSLQSDTLKHSANITETPLDTSDPMCKKCLTERDRKFFDQCGARSPRYIELCVYNSARLIFTTIPYALSLFMT